MVEKPRQEHENLRQDGLLRNSWVRLATALGILLAVALLVALGVLVRWYFTSDLPTTERKDLVQGLASAAQAFAVLFTGLVALIGLYFTRRNTDRQLAQARESTEKQLRQARESQERTQASAQKTLRLTEQGQITERFMRAIDQLGSDKLEVRLGAIYALERIARDSEEDHWPIMEVLTAYVREHAPWPVKVARQRPVPDVQAILTVLGRRSRYYGNGEDEPLDLSDTDLRRANLTGAHLEHAHLAGARLTGASLGGAHLEGAILENAYLSGAYLAGARLEGAYLGGAILDEAILDAAILDEVIHLTQEQIDRAHGDRETTLPEGLAYPEEWPKSRSEILNRLNQDEPSG